jgi:hypothetical protein
MKWLLARGSDSFASNKFRALQQFFKWLAAVDRLARERSGPKLRAGFMEAPS